MPEEPKTVKVYARTRPTDHFAYNHIVLNPDGKVTPLRYSPVYEQFYISQYLY